MIKEGPNPSFLGAFNANAAYGDDLDNYIKTCKKRDNFTNYSHNPWYSSHAMWGLLIVINIDYYSSLQMIFSESTSENWYRHRYDGVWHTWFYLNLNPHS